MPKVNAAVAQTKNSAQGEVFSKTLGQPHGTARTSLSTDAAVTASEVLVDGLAELRKNYFRTSENPYPISRFGAFDPKSRDLLPGTESIRTDLVGKIWEYYLGNTITIPNLR